MSIFKLVLPFNRINVQQTAQRLAEQCKYKSQYVSNFVMANNGLICCFSGMALYLTDSHFNPLLIFECQHTFIASCGISDQGKYAFCQMAYNRFDDEESAVSVLFNIKSRNAIAVRKLETDPNLVRQIHVDEQDNSVNIYTGIKKRDASDRIYLLKYDINLQPSEKTLTFLASNGLLDN